MMSKRPQHHTSGSGRLTFACLAVTVAAMSGAVGLVACESYETGATRSKHTKTVETPTEKSTTTTTHEKKVEPY